MKLVFGNATEGRSQRAAHPSSPSLGPWAMLCEIRMAFQALVGLAGVLVGVAVLGHPNGAWPGVEMGPGSPVLPSPLLSAAGVSKQYHHHMPAFISREKWGAAPGNTAL